jgi:hypothetical protein
MKKVCETCAKRYNKNGNIIGACPEFVNDYKYYYDDNKNNRSDIEPPCWVERKNRPFYVVWNGDTSQPDSLVQVEDVTPERAKEKAKTIAKNCASNIPGREYFILRAEAKYVAFGVEETELK